MDNKGKGKILNRLLADKKSGKIILIIGIIGVALLLLSSFGSDENHSQGKVNESMSSGEYCEMLEKKTAEVVKKITGTSGVTVAITLKNGTEYIYATELKEDSDTTEDIGGGEQIKTQMSGSSEERYIVIDDGNGGEKPLIISEISPQVKGAVIVCLKGLNELQKAQITESVSVLLNISEQNISVIGRS